ncbi:MAG TPA: TlpA disulfide reductase family protein [Puia sp.]|nr:TlpA disulfide reductase family protein [Puia sp.]
MLKNIILIGCMTMLAMAVFPQAVRKMKVTELEAYIHSCDHPLIVSFWATFCAPCVAEIPYFQSITEKYRDLRPELLLVSLDLPEDYPSKIADFARKKNFTAGLAWLNESNADYFCPKIDKGWSGAIPSTLFVNNKTGYRRFFEQSLTAALFEETTRAMLAL